MISSGDLGPVRKVVVEYPQGWLTDKLEDEGQKQAIWRSDPPKQVKQVYGDIGTHAEYGRICLRLTNNQGVVTDVQGG